MTVPEPESASPGTAPGKLDIVVSVQDVTFAYRDHEDEPVLHGIDLEVRRGEFLVVAGRTGSGKSTLCYAISGLVPNSLGGEMGGSVEVEGVRTTAVSVAELARTVGIVQQSPESQIIGLTVSEDVEFGLENLALPPPEIAARTAEALTTVGLTGLGERSPWRLSGGQKQRLAIAAALAFSPSVLVLDNPVAELDPIGRSEVFRTIGLLNRERKITIVLVCQDLSEIVGYAERVVVLDAGRIVTDGPVADVLADAGGLRRAGVRVPDLIQLGERLDDAVPGSARFGPLLTVEDAESAVRHMTSPGTGVGPRAATHGSAVLGPTWTRPAPVAAPRPGAVQDAMVEFADVHFAYPGGPPILRGVNWRIHAGEFVALMGPNGAGKTTLGKHLNGLLRPTRGTVSIAGRPTAGRRVSELATQVGYVFQNPDHQIVSRSIAEEFALGPRNLGWSADRISEAVSASLDFLGLSGRGEADPFMLGLAERNLVALATALIVKPQILVLDEPATGADHAVIERLLRRVAGLHADGMTVLMVTHDASIVAEYAQRLVVVADGAIVLDGTPGEVFHQVEPLIAAQITPPPVAALVHRLEDLQIPRNAITVPALADALGDLLATPSSGCLRA